MKRGLCWVWRLTHARSQIGTRVGGIKPYYRGHKVTVIGAVSLKKVLAVMTMNDSMDGSAFAVFIEKFLCPQLWLLCGSSDG